MPHETTHRFLASELPVAEPESCLFHVLPVPLELRCRMPEGRRGARKPFLRLPISLNCGMANPSPPKRAFIRGHRRHSGSPETVLGRVEAAVGGILDCNGLPVLLGGEHTVTYGALAALKSGSGHSGSSSSTRTRTCATAMREPVEPCVRHAACGQGFGAAAGQFGVRACA